MNESPTPTDQADANQRHGELFAGLVLQQVNMALMFLGRLPGPDGQPAPKDLNAAGIFVDTLEMLEAKTRGNLSKDESEFLRQSLSSARMAFVQVVNEPEPKAAPAEDEPPAVAGTPPPADPAAPEPSPADTTEDKVRFSKKY